jgi:membrane-associated phospholipid phosphatase
MLSKTRYWAAATALVMAVTAWGCADTPSQPSNEPSIQRDAVKFWETTASTSWNEYATELLTQFPPASNGQAAASRMITYVSLAQYRAVGAAEAGKEGSMHPRVSAAVSAASAVVLGNFFPPATAAIQARLSAELADPGWPGEQNDDAAAGEAIGREVGAAVLAQAASDRYGLVPLPPQPVGPGYWVSSGAATVRSLFGVVPFFMSSQSQLRPPAPPAYGSPEFLAALAEVQEISDTRTADQLAIAVFWNAAVGPFTAGKMNLIADELIAAHHRTEREAARILAFANAAAFDAQIACFDAKFTLPIGLPNHPSYPSGHACITGAIMTVLIDAFPSERDYLEGVIELAGLSRIYGGLHYRFDIEAGGAIGKGAAALALRGTLD